MRALWLAAAALALAAPLRPARSESCFSDAQLTLVDATAASCANCSACAAAVVPDCDFLLLCRSSSADADSTSSSNASLADVGEYVRLAAGQDANAVRAFWTTVAAVDQVTLSGGDLQADGLPNATLPAAALPPSSAVLGLQSLKFRNVSFAANATLPDLSALSSLTLSGCALTALSPLLASPTLLRGLTALDLSANALSAVPDAVYALSSLRSLHMERNAVSEARLNASQFAFLSTLDALAADADAFQRANCAGGGAVVYFASNPALAVCDPAAYSSSSSSSSSSASSSASASTASSSTGDSQRPALIAGTVAISGGLLVALVAKLLSDRRRRLRKEETRRAREVERETESSLGALATMSPPATPASDDHDHNASSNASGRDDWYHTLRGDAADAGLPGARALLQRCGLAGWHRDPALVALEQPLGDLLAAADAEEGRSSTTIVSSGGGGLGDLWLGRYRDERVAVRRVPLAGGDGCEDARSLREPALLAAMAHPNVLRLRGVSYSSSLGLLVLYELMDRGDLRGYLRARYDCQSDRQDGDDRQPDDGQDRGETSWWGSRRLEIALDVARALLYLHSRRRAAHGALSARFVLLDHEFTAKLAGFGRCRPLSDAADAPPSPPSRPDDCLSLAPEVLAQEAAAASEAADVYAFGALLLELDAGQPPFRRAAARLGWSDAQLLQRLAAGPDAAAMAELADASPACPAALRLLLASCLAREPQERPTAAALVAVLKSVLAAATEPEDAALTARRKRRKTPRRP